VLENQPPNTPELPKACPSETSAKPTRRRSKKATRPQLLTRAQLDGRTNSAKRARAIAAELEAGFGVRITKVQRQAIERAAMLCAIAEDLACRRLAGQPVSIDELLRSEGVARRATKAVLAERPAPPPAPRFSPMKALREAEAARKAAQTDTTTEKAPLDEHPAAD
jgi:hypothetical protein